MNPTAIDYIWQAIRDSERSDEIQLMDDELRQTAEAAQLALLVRSHVRLADHDLSQKATLIP